MNWPFLNRTSHRNSFVDERISFPLRLRWKSNVNASILSQISGSYEDVFFCSIDGTYGISASDGSIVWRFECPEPEDGGSNAFKSSPAIMGHSLLVADMRGNIYKLDRTDGHLVGGISDFRAVSEPFCLHGGKFFSKSTFTEQGKGKYAYSCLDEDLTLLWSTEVEHPISTISCAIDGKYLIFGDGSGALHCVHSEMGEPLWSRDIGSLVSIVETPYSNPTRHPRGLPIIIDDILIVRAGDFRNLLALDVETGEFIWGHVCDADFDFSDEAMSIGTDNEHIYYVMRSRVRRLNLKSGAGTTLADHSDRDLGDSLSLLGLTVGDYYFAGFNERKRLMAFNKHTGKIVWEFTGDGGFSHSPVWIYGKLYIGDDMGNVYCFEQSPQ